jgi:hypothetical protein
VERKEERAVWDRRTLFVDISIILPIAFEKWVWSGRDCSFWDPGLKGFHAILNQSRPDVANIFIDREHTNAGTHTLVV